MSTETDEFYREVGEKHLVPLWNITQDALPAEPQSPVKPYLWRWADLRPAGAPGRGPGAHRAGG